MSGCRQDPWLFATTLHDDLLLARPTAGRDLERTEREADALLTLG